MGTGSVALWFLRLFWVCRRCLSPFSDGQWRAPWKKGQAPRGYCFPRNSGRYPLGASPHFPLPAYSLRKEEVAKSKPRMCDSVPRLAYGARYE